MKQHKPAIDVLKGDTLAPRSDEPIDFVEEREKRVTELMEYLCTPSDAFKAERAFDMLENYISIHARVLYSTISNIIYELQNAKETDSRLETLRANVDALLHYSENKELISHRKQCLPENHTPEMVDNTRKAVWKIWDHITLAYQQYVMLKQSDEEYDEKFKARIAGYKEEMSKEMNAQMITMVGIFTALAFLVFGSISSLDGIFEQNAIPLFKVICVALVWGLCVLNLVFVFLFCIGKMTKLNFKSSEYPDATIFQRYPIVWWTNLSLISLLMLSLWGYFVQHNQMFDFMSNLCNQNPPIAFIFGSLVILCLIVLGFRWLGKKTAHIGSCDR